MAEKNVAGRGVVSRSRCSRAVPAKAAMTAQTGMTVMALSTRAPLRLARPDLDPVRRRLARAHTVADLREIARRRTPRPVFDYADGAAEGEVSLRRARDAFAALEFRPSV